MSKNNDHIAFIPTTFRECPPTKLIGQEDGRDVYRWYIAEDEYLRLTKLFGRDFQETGVGGTLVLGLPSQCTGCKKYTEFIDWVWTALHRGAHTTGFMFQALKDGRQGIETSHDVYCSECGRLTIMRSKDNCEGGAEDIQLAGKLDRMTHLPHARKPITSHRKAKVNSSSKVQATWGKWWLDNNGSTAAYRASHMGV